MKKSAVLFRKTTAVILAVLVAATTLFSFSLTADAKAKKYVTSIKAAKKKITLTVGKSTSVKITVKVAKKASKKFTVKSNKKSVATAKVQGSKVKITAQKAGKAKITVTTKAKGKKGKKLKATITVTVKAKSSSGNSTKPATNPESNYYGSSSSYDNPIVLRLGSNESLYNVDAVFREKSAQIDAAKTEFESSDSAVVFINNAGMMTGNRVTDKPVYIYATITDKQGNMHCFTAYVTVSDIVPPTTLPPVDSLGKISVTASPTAITVGGTSKLTVTSVSEGVSIARVEYKSSNETIATVDSDGVVTGRTASNSPIVITATAYDAKGNSASATVSITVLGASGSDAKISEVPENLVLGIGVTRKLNPVASDAGESPVFTYVSDNPSVATVNDSGEITTVSNGEARITVTIAGTTASAVCVVKVTDAEVGISSFSATHARILTINLTVPVYETDRDKVEITLKKGSAVMDVKKEWSDDGYSVNLTTDAEFEATVYTVKIASDEVSIDEKNNTADCTVAKHEVVDVKITSQRIPRANGAKIYFDAVDNYGDKIEDADPDMFNWQFSCDDTKVRTTDIVWSVAKPDCIVLENFKEIEDVVVDSTVISVQAILKKDSDIRSDRHNVAVVSLVIDKIEINDIETINGAKYIYQDTTTKPYKLVYTAVDQYGDPIDWSIYKPNSSDNAYNNTFQAHSDNEDVVSAPTIFNDELVVYVKANMHGTAKVYAVAKDPNYKTYTIEVLETPKPQRIVFPDSKEHSLVAGEDTDYKVPVTFTDQYGTEMTKGSVTKKAFTSAFTSNPSNKDLIIDYVSDSEGDFIVFNGKNLTSETESVNVVFTAFNDNDEPITSAFKIKIDAERRPDSIKFTNDIPSSLVVGETAEFKFRVLDNRGELWTDPTGIIIEMIANDVGNYVELVKVDFDEECNGVMVIRGVSESTVNLDPHITLKFKLYYMGTEISSTTFTPPQVIVYKNLDDIKVSTDVEKGKAIKSGQSVELTFTAYNNEKLLDTYNHTYSKVVVTEYDADMGKTDSDKTQLVTVEFINGQATVTIEAQTAGNIVYETTIAAVGVANPFTLTTAPAIKVNPGDASYYDLVLDKSDGASLTIICRDKNGNVVKDYSPSESTYITLKDSNDTALSADEYFNNVATKNGEIISEFTDAGTLTLTLKKALPKDVEITVKTGSITKTIKV